MPRLRSLHLNRTFAGAAHVCADATIEVAHLNRPLARVARVCADDMIEVVPHESHVPRRPCTSPPVMRLRSLRLNRTFAGVAQTFAEPSGNGLATAWQRPPP